MAPSPFDDTLTDISSPVVYRTFMPDLTRRLRRSFAGITIIAGTPVNLD